MSDAQNQGEPTMEEILASIRKIISEDGTPEGEEGEDQEATAEEIGEEAPAAEAEPAPEPEPGPAAAEAEPDDSAADDSAPDDSVPDDSAGEPAGEEDDDVLDLTQMVGEDGGIVDLKEEPEEAAAGPDPELPEDVEDIPELVAVDDLDDIEPIEEPEAPPIDDSLLANTTQTAVTSSLAQMAVAATPASAADGIITGNGKTLEVLVREVLEPYLKTWLDENLAGMVERIVRDEVQKMARRAEYR